MNLQKECLHEAFRGQSQSIALACDSHEIAGSQNDARVMRQIIEEHAVLRGVPLVARLAVDETNQDRVEAVAALRHDEHRVGEQ